MLATAEVARLHVVTDDEVLRRDSWPRDAAAVLEAGGAALAVHLRGPRSSGAVLYELARRLLPEARRAGARLVVNDRVDVALTSGVGHVHLGVRSMPLDVVRALVGPERLIGLSCHSESELEGARVDGADYAFLGAVHATPSHPDAITLGVSGVRVLVDESQPLPVIAIGGVGVEAVPELIAAGAWGVAAIRGVWDAPDPARAVSEYISACENLNG